MALIATQSVQGRIWRSTLILVAAFVFIRASVLSAAQETRPADIQVREGISLMKAGEMERALESFKEANRLDPTSAPALVWIGIAQNQLSRFQEAASSFRSALKIDATAQSAHYNLALSLVRLGERENAIHELEVVVEATPTAVDAQYNLALLLEQAGQYVTAIPHLQRARRESADDPSIALHLIGDYFQTGNDVQAILLAKEVFRTNQDSAVAERLGSLLVGNNRFAEAVPILEAAVRTPSPPFETITLLARAYIGANAPAKAIDLLKPSENADASGQAAYYIGLAYLSAKQSEQAIDAFRKAARRRPENALAHFHLGILLLTASGESGQEGAEEIEQAIALTPREGMYYAVLGRWMLEHDQSAAALPVLEKATENAEPTAVLEFLLGITQVAVQGAEAGRQAIEKAIALDPTLAAAHDVLGFCYFRLGDYEHAFQSYRRAAELAPERNRFAYDTALSLERMNRNAEAIPYAEKAVSFDPQDGSKHYLLGKLYSKAGRKNEAIHELETAVRLNPRLDYPCYLLARIYAQLGNMPIAQQWNAKFTELKRLQDAAVRVGTPASEPGDGLSPSSVLSTPPPKNGSPALEENDHPVDAVPAQETNGKERIEP
jgi:tetratricopeptide (TPR) repeat protein